MMIHPRVGRTTFEGSTLINLHLVTTLLFLTLISPALGQDCPVDYISGCSCRVQYQTLRTITCQNLGSLASMPQFGSSDYIFDSFQISLGTSIKSIQALAFQGLSITNLQLQSLRIERVDENAFLGLGPSLTQLSLDDNQLVDLPVKFLSSLTKLQYLGLPNNFIKVLDPALFSGLGNLMQVMLYSNVIQSIPSGLLKDTGRLSIFQAHFNEISEIKSDTFGNLTQLTDVILNDNKIRSIQPGAFSQLTSLMKLNLKNNDLGQISHDTISGSRALTYLDLTNNEISSATSDAFSDFPLLKTLYLKGNHLQNLPTGLFDNVQNLDYLDLSENNLVGLPDRLLSRLSKLTTLYLHRNDIHTINRQTFYNLSTVVSLSLYENSIEQIPADTFTDLISVTSIDINTNSIHNIEPGSFSACQKLSSLNIRQNRLEFIPQNVFQNLPSLSILYLGYNKITSIKSGTFNNLPALSSLDLTSNLISSIDDGAFVGLQMLKYLSLDKNNLSSVPVKSLEPVANITTLNLDYNFIKSIDDFSFSKLAMLQRLMLTDNLISNVGRNSFSGLKSLDTLYIQDNLISSLPDYVFGPDLSKLRYLNLSTNLLVNIPTESFHNTSLLQQLDLSANSISRIADSNFIEIPQLQLLRLDNNPLTYLSPTAFKGLEQSLQTLTMTQCNVTDLMLLTFQNLQSLMSIDLTGNLIQSIPDDTFNGCLNLNLVGLSGNKLSTMSPMIASKLSYAGSLDLSWNNFTEDSIKNLQYLDNIQVLSLAGNNLSVLVTDVFQIKPRLPRFQYLKVIDVSYNNLNSSIWDVLSVYTTLTSITADNNIIERLPDLNSFSNMSSQLVTLSLRNNQLTGSDLLSLAACTQLNAIYLDYNNIEMIPDNTFTNLFNLGTLSMNGNRLTRLTNSTFSQLSVATQKIYINSNLIDTVEPGAFALLRSLKELDLSNNRIKSLALPSTMSQLLYLQLSGNQMTSFPDGLDSYPLLNTLDMSNNSLSSLPQRLMYNSLQITKIDFSHNQLTNIDSMTYAGTILYIDYSYNQLTDIKQRILNKTTTVVVLDLSHNLFTYPPDPVIRSHPLSTIIDLRLDYNQIPTLENYVDPPSDIKSTVESFSMRGNKLTLLPQSVTTALNFSLISLDLRDNNLRTLDQQALLTLDHLAELKISGNPLTCDCQLAWLRQLYVSGVSIDQALCASPSDKAGYHVLCYSLSACSSDVRSQYGGITIDMCSTMTLPPSTSTASQPSPTSPPIPPTSSTRNSSSQTSSVYEEGSGPSYSKAGLIAGLICGFALLAVLIAAFVIYYKSKQRRMKSEDVTVRYNGFDKGNGTVTTNGVGTNGVENPGYIVTDTDKF